MKLGKLKIALQKILAETFAQVSTNKGILAWDGDSQMPEVGQNVYSFDEEGNQIDVEDGNYELEDGTVIVVEGGKVAEIRDPQKADSGEETPAQEDAEGEGEGDGEGDPDNGDPDNGDPDNGGETVVESADEPAEGESDAERIANLEAEIARLEEENGALRERIAELEGKPAAEPAEEEFKRVNKLEMTGNKHIDNLVRILNA